MPGVDEFRVSDEAQVDDPGGLGVPAREVFAWVVVHGEGDESVAGVQTLSGWMPMVVQQREVANRLRPAARALAAASGKRVQLVRFERVAVVDEVTL